MAPPRDDFVWEADVDTAGMDDPLASVSTTIDGDKLRVTIAGDTQCAAAAGPPSSVTWLHALLALLAPAACAPSPGCCGARARHCMHACTPALHARTPSIRTCREVALPEDAFTDDASAKLAGRKLVVRIARRDPDGPAMQVCGGTGRRCWR